MFGFFGLFILVVILFKFFGNDKQQKTAKQIQTKIVWIFAIAIGFILFYVCLAVFWAESHPPLVDGKPVPAANVKHKTLKPGQLPPLSRAE